MPTLDEVVLTADDGLHPRVHRWVSRPARLAALREELAWSVTTAVDDLGFAREFAAAQPQSGQPSTAFLNRWVRLADDLSVLVGPRYRGRDPRYPFVVVDASTRRLTPADMLALRTLAQDEFAGFTPGYVRVWSAEPAGAWPGTRGDSRMLAGRLGDLRRRSIPLSLTARPAADLAFYDRYTRIHVDHVAREPAHALHSRVETREDLAHLLAAGTLFEVLVDGDWAGVIAAEPDARCGLRGFTVVELLLDPPRRGQGLGRHLSTLLARLLPGDDEGFLLGTIHIDNVASYRSAIAAGRVDIGGEIIIDLTHAQNAAASRATEGTGIGPT